MSSPRADFLSGVRVAAPITLGVAPFGMVAGVAAVGVGMSAVQAVAMSIIVFAGASQLAAIELVGQNAPAAVVVLTVVVVNLRLVMYSASIAPHFQRQSAKWKAALSYLLTDQAYAISLLKFENDEETSRRWYYLGVAVPLWVTWQASTIAGVLLGARLPPGLQLEFAVPLVFLAVLVPAVTDRATGAAAVVGGTTAVAANGLPYNLGLIAAAVVGIGAGLVVESLASADSDETDDADDADEMGDREEVA
ncbi:AzlC family ABC transporter permease [Halorussus ruber]|uniref:AzlC family ABC transporter permease n=1 Tax=Halorussus ruber TaxID=1126238 RepID=UPI0010932F8C|nr:AzlC family ABC transporter permease [Halorussus ruber]